MDPVIPEVIFVFDRTALHDGSILEDFRNLGGLALLERDAGWSSHPRNMGKVQVLWLFFLNGDSHILGSELWPRDSGIWNDRGWVLDNFKLVEMHAHPVKG